VIANWQAEDAPLIRPDWIASKYHDVWGIEINNREFAVMSTRKGTHIIDVTDIEEGDSLVSLYFFEAAYQGLNAAHRDFHDYNGHLYVVCDEGESTLQIIDISKLPEEAKLVYDSNELFSTSHNVFIDTATARLYVAGVGSENLLVLNVENPAKPEELYLYNTNYTHDIFVRNNIGYLNQGPDGLKIVEFGVEDGDALGTLTEYEDKGYNHSGWLSEDGKYYALCDENHGYRVKLLNVSDFNDIKVVSLFGAGITDNSIAHNVIIKDHYAFVSYYYDGLQIFDFSNPEKVKKVAQFDTYLEANNRSYKGVWGVYPNLKSEKILVSDMQTGLYVFEVDLAPVADFIINGKEELNVYEFISTARWKPYGFDWIINGIEVSNEENFIYDFQKNPFQIQADNMGNFNVCLEVTNNQGSHQKCVISPLIIVDVSNTLGIQSFETNIYNDQLFLNYSLSKKQHLWYTLHDLSGRLLYKNKHEEIAGEVQKMINLKPAHPNNIDTNVAIG